MWFYEHLKHGRWWPVTTTIEPATVAAAGRTRLKGVNGLGAEIRCLAEIPPSLHHLTLGQLAEVYGLEGRFRATAGQGAA